VPSSLTEMLWAMQPEATEATEAVEGAPQQKGGPAAGAPPGCGAPGQQTLIMMVLMFGIIYLLMIRPQQKKQRETEAMLKSLRVGDRVRTSGGIRGEIVDLDDTEVTLLIAEKTKINVLRTYILGKEEKKSVADKIK
jgi:preprotein translocase subunit YajC